MIQSPNATKCVTIEASSSDEEEIVSTEKIKFKRGANRVYYPDQTTLPEDFEDKDQFRFFLTSKTLVESSSHAKLVLQRDGTYKLLWLRNPVLLIGIFYFISLIFYMINLVFC